MRHLCADLVRRTARLLAPEAQAGVHGDPVQPGAEGAVPPEAFYVGPGPDPGLLARVLGLLATEHAKRYPAHGVGVGMDQLRESLDVAAGGTCDQRPLCYGTHSAFS